VEGCRKVYILGSDRNAMSVLAWFPNVAGKLQGLRNGVERRSAALTYFQTAKKHKNSGINFWARSCCKKKKLIKAVLLRNLGSAAKVQI